MRKHHGGSLEDHIVLVEEWSIEDTTLTLSFEIETMSPTGQVYQAQWELSRSELQDELDEHRIIELIAEQLRRPPERRTWHKPGE